MRTDGVFRQGRRFVGQSQEAALVGGVSGVRDQFAEKNLAVGIERMHHQIEQAANFGPELAGFFSVVDIGHAILVDKRRKRLLFVNKK